MILDNFWMVWTKILTYCTFTFLSLHFYPSLCQVNSSTVDGQTPLSEACAWGHVTCVSLLLRHGATPSGTNQSCSPIHRAAAKGERSHSTDSTHTHTHTHTDNLCWTRISHYKMHTEHQNIRNTHLRRVDVLQNSVACVVVAYKAKWLHILPSGFNTAANFKARPFKYINSQCDDRGNSV